jgi:hypothetical protein
MNSLPFITSARIEYRTPNSRVPLFVSVVTVLFQSVAGDMGCQQFKQYNSNRAFSKLLPSNGRLFLLDYSGLQPPRHNIFLFSTAPRPDLGHAQRPIQWVPGALFRGGKRYRREANPSAPYSADIKNARSYTSTSSYIFMKYCLNNQAQVKILLHFFTWVVMLLATLEFP